MRKTKYTFELLLPVVQSSRSISQVLTKLSLKLTGGNYRNINKWIDYHEIDTSHFKGQGWSKGETASTDSSVEVVTKKISATNDEIFCENSRYSKSSTIIKKLCEEFARDYKCETCGIDAWMGEKLRLHLDHINGKHNDNSIENLRLICPNCHSQTETYCRKKKRLSDGTGIHA